MLKLKYFIQVWVFILISAVFYSCHKNGFQRQSSEETRRSYQSLFSNKSLTEELEKIERTVELVYGRTVYKSYLFEPGQRIQHQEISDSILKTAYKVQFLRKTVLGTATILYSEGSHVGLLSCAHIFDEPDTVVTYTADIANNEQYVTGISIKESQSNFTSAKSRIGELEVVLSDFDNDIAILTNKRELLTPLHWAKVFHHPFGKAKDLKWGTFVFIFGYPNGQKVLTKALVSSPDRDNKGSFTVDSFFNMGLSGGLVLAIREGGEEFEIVGMLHSAAGEQEAILVPDNTKNLPEGSIYEGSPIVHYQPNIKQGITYAVSSETIVGLLKKNERYLLQNGLNFRYIIEDAEK